MRMTPALSDPLPADHPQGPLKEGSGITSTAQDMVQSRCLPNLSTCLLGAERSGKTVI